MVEIKDKKITRNANKADLVLSLNKISANYRFLNKQVIEMVVNNEMVKHL